MKVKLRKVKKENGFYTPSSFTHFICEPSAKEYTEEICKYVNSQKI